LRPDHLSILCTTQIRFEAVGFYAIRVALMLLAMTMMLLNRLYLENINIMETKLEVPLGNALATSKKNDALLVIINVFDRKNRK